jgi:hypothetical protein
MKRCAWRGVNTHPTRDSVTFSDAAAEQSAVALFKPGHNSTCKCMAEGTDPKECDGLYITDENGGHLATLHGASLRARQLENGSLAIYRASVKTSDTAADDTPERINRRNAEFWKPREE